MKRHACHRRGSLDQFRTRTGLEQMDPTPAPGGGLWFGYVQDGEAMHWISAGDVEFLVHVPHLAGRHMGWHNDGDKLGAPRWFGNLHPTRFEDGGALTILVDAVEAHGRTSHIGRQLVEVLLDMRRLCGGETSPP